jgi:hypothetical protein
MPNFRNARWIFLSVLAGLSLLGAVIASSAGAAGYGETLRFNGKGTGSIKGSPFDLEEQVHAFGVDTETNSIFVGDEETTEEEFNEKFRIQMYNAKGEYQADAILKPAKSLPKTIREVSSLDGVAVDPSLKRVYVLVTYTRELADSVDPGIEESGAVYAFSTVPTEKKLPPAEGDENATTGLFASIKTLHGESEIQGESLLKPTGITVDPRTHEVLILGQVDASKNSDGQLALERLSDSGALQSRYVDPDELEPPNVIDSPVVSANGRIFVEAEGKIEEIPSSLTGAPKTLFQFEEPEELQEGSDNPFKEELLTLGPEGISGGALSIISEGPDEGRLVAQAEILETTETGELGISANPAILNFHYTEVGENTEVTETGWVGGQGGAEGTAQSCAIGYEALPLVAAASGDMDFVLAPSTREVLEFGPGGSGCPEVKAAASGVEALLDGKKDSAPNTTTTVVLAAKLLGANAIVSANVLKVEWKFGDGTKAETVTVAPGEQTQTAEIEHKFAVGGKVTVEAVIHTDNLTTPEIKVSTTLNVSNEALPKITKSPASKTVVEGEPATFEAAGTGYTSVQWEESSNGTSWSPVSGATSTTLQLSSTTEEENGREYHAVFTNAAGPQPSNAATLTVETKAAHAAKVAKEAEEAQKAKEAQEANEATQRANEATQRANEAAQKAASEAAQKAAGEAAQRAKEAEEAAQRAKQGVLGVKEGSPSASLASTSLSVSSSGAVTIKVSCPTGVSTCTGTVTFRTLTAVVARAAGHATQAKSKAAILTLASGSFAVPGGGAKTITLHLSSAGRKLLGKAHSLRVRATIVARNHEGTSHTTQLTVTLRAAKAKHG